MAFHKIAMAAWKGIQMGRKHAPKIPHLKKPRATAGYLGRSLTELRDLWEDNKTGPFFTMYESVEKIIEVKAFMYLTAWNLDLEVKGKSQFQILQEIVDTLKAENATGAVREIEKTMAWTQEFVQRPEVVSIFNESNVEIPKLDPLKPMEWPKVGLKFMERLGQEATRIHKLMKVAKKPGNDNKGPQNKGPGL